MLGPQFGRPEQGSHSVTAPIKGFLEAVLFLIDGPELFLLKRVGANTYAEFRLTLLASPILFQSFGDYF
jgi:hypothetical protein